MNAVVILDDQTTWPAAVATFAEEWAGELRGGENVIGELEIGDGDNFLELFDDAKIRTYHCTRLLPSERDDIRTHGLRPLSWDLRQGRVARAAQSGLISEKEAAWLLEQSKHAVESATREGFTCLVTSFKVFDEEPHGFFRLLKTWGGEALYIGAESATILSRLRRIGEPAIVAADVEIRQLDRYMRLVGLDQAFVGAHLGLPGTALNVYCEQPIPGLDVAAIWSPGDPEYDRHGSLPRD